MSTLQKVNHFIRESITLKLLGIGILALIMLIPSALVQDVIRERQNLRDSAIRTTAQQWGLEQTVASPVLQVPYTRIQVLSDGKTETSRGYAYFLPSELELDSDVSTERRKRGIYTAVLYKADLQLSGRFDSLELGRLDVEAQDLDWSRASLSFGINDLRGIDSLSTLRIGSRSVEFKPGTPEGGLLSSGFQAPLTEAESLANGAEFSFSVKLRGSSDIEFVPLAARTRLEMSSDWASPKFTGAFLPDERELSKEGFRASWEVLEVNRPFNSQGTLMQNSMGLQVLGGSDLQSAMGVPEYDEFGQMVYPMDRGANLMSTAYNFGLSFMQPVDDYRKTWRSARYASLFIAATFLTFFFSEILKGRRVHPVQYLLVGSAVVLFYLLLLSISEHIGFDLAYLLAALVIVLLISAYAWAVLSSPKLVGLIAGILTLLYVFFYSLLQLEDFSLLIGSLGLLLALGVLMYLTRKQDWYRPSEESAAH